MRPGETYVDDIDFASPITLSVGNLPPGRGWYPYMRGSNALNLRVATGAAQSKAVGWSIEVVTADEPVGAMVRDLLANHALTKVAEHPADFAGQSGRVIDLRIARKATLSTPDSLSGEEVVPAQGMRAFVIGGKTQSVAALVITDKQRDLPAFLPAALRVVRSIRS